MTPACRVADDPAKFVSEFGEDDFQPCAEEFYRERPELMPAEEQALPHLVIERDYQFVAEGAMYGELKDEPAHEGRLESWALDGSDELSICSDDDDNYYYSSNSDSCSETTAATASCGNESFEDDFSDDLDELAEAEAGAWECRAFDAVPKSDGESSWAVEDSTQNWLN